MRVAELREMLKVARKETQKPVSKMKQADLIEEGIARGILPKRNPVIEEVGKVIQEKEKEKQKKVEMKRQESPEPVAKKVLQKGAKKVAEVAEKAEKAEKVKRAPTGFAKFISENKGKGMGMKELAAAYRERKE